MLTPVRAHTGMVRTNAAVHRRFYHNRLWEKETLIAVGYGRDHLVRPVQTDLDNRSFRAGTKDNPVRRRHLSTKERGAPGHTCHGIGPRMTHAQPHLPSVTTKEENNTDARVVSEKQLSVRAVLHFSRKTWSLLLFGASLVSVCGCYSLVHSLKSLLK